MLKNRVLIFDLDDTLIDTWSLFRQAMDEFANLMINMGFQETEVRYELNHIDVENLRQLGFSRKRFPLSMIQTYDFLCKHHNKEPKDRVRDQCWAIGNSVFEQTPRMIDGAKETLHTLKDRFSLRLLTKGDETVQFTRLDQTSLRPFFDAVYIVPDKNEDQLANLIHLEGIDPTHTWVIGDSPRSDIYPALMVGINCVWIPRDTWGVEQCSIDLSKVVTLNSLYELRDFFASLPD